MLNKRFATFWGAGAMVGCGVGGSVVGGWAGVGGVGGGGAER